MTAGGFSFVLHAHIPYVRKAGVWPFGEEWLFEVMADTYIPLIRMLEDIPAPGKPLLSIGLTPVLLEQLADGYIKQRFEQYLYQRLDLCAKDMEHHRDRPQRRELARMYEENYHQVLALFQGHFSRDLVAGFRRLQDANRVELLTSAATHGYLPLLGTESSIRAQVRLGVQSFERHFGRRPRGIWLPECGYRPAGRWRYPASGDEFDRPGIESFLADEGLEYFVVDHHTIEGGRAEGIYWDRFPFLQRGGRQGNGPHEFLPSGRTTYRPYYMKSDGRTLAVFGRNEKTGLQVWSGEWGYPGDGWYREFHKRDSISGLQYWRVTDRQNRDLGAKLFYEPDKVGARIDENSNHFVETVRDLVDKNSADFRPIVAATYDTELFGHWWFEGIRWMRQVLEKLPKAGVEPLSLGAYLSEHPPSQMISLPESSWGAGGDHRIWLNNDTVWIWQEIYAAEKWMEHAVAEYRGREDLKELLRQAARELLLMESSDWEFLITTFQARDYGVNRFNDHLGRFNALRHAIEGKGTADLYGIQQLDNLFAEIDISVYEAPRGGK
jgi:1,4-alpha-glucan branching enzyme